MWRSDTTTDPRSDMSEYVLEDDHLLVSFDGTYGTLTRVELKRTGWRVQRRPELARSFGLLVPVEGKRDNRVGGCNVQLSDATLTESKRSLEMRWDHPRTEAGEELDITVSACVTLVEQRIEFTCSLSNRTSHVIEACVWPWLGDLSRPERATQFHHFRFEYGDAVQTQLFPRFPSDRGYFGVDRPIQLTDTPTSPFVLAHDDSQGLYVGYHDATAEQFAQFRFELFPGFAHTEGFEMGAAPREDTLHDEPVHLECAVVHFPFAGPGETPLGDVVLAPYEGTWHNGVDIYRFWRDTWYTPPRRPAWLEEVHSWQQIHVNSPEEEYFIPYRDLPQIGEDCAAHGVKAIQVTGWASGGQDRGNPSHDTDPGLGTREEFIEAIRQVEAMGVHIILFSKFTWSDRSSPWYREELKDYAMRDPYGDPYYHAGYMYQTETQLANINTRRFVPMCMRCDAWLDTASAEFEKLLRMGASGTLYDECQHHGGANYCFSPDHGHDVPAHVYGGDARLAIRFREAIEKSDRDFVLAGEDCYDLQLPYYHLSYFRIGRDHLPARRYMAQDTEMMVGVYGYNNRAVINQALLFRYILSYEPRNFKGRLTEFPLTLEYGKRVDSLRARYADYLWQADFRDTMGAHISILEGPDAVRHTVFISREHGRRAVVAVNQDDEQPTRVRVDLEPRDSKFCVVTPEVRDAVSCHGEVTIPPLSAVVFLELQSNTA